MGALRCAPRSIALKSQPGCQNAAVVLDPPFEWSSRSGEVRGLPKARSVPASEKSWPKPRSPLIHENLERFPVQRRDENGLKAGLASRTPLGKIFQLGRNDTVPGRKDRVLRVLVVDDHIASAE